VLRNGGEREPDAILYACFLYVSKGLYHMNDQFIEINDPNNPDSNPTPQQAIKSNQFNYYHCYHRWSILLKDKTDEGITLLTRCKRCGCSRSEIYSRDLKTKSFIKRKLAYLKGSYEEEIKTGE